MKTIRAMKGQRLLIGVLLLGLLLAPAAGLVMAQGPGPQGDDTSLAPLGSAFTYQGRLKNASGLVNNTCNFRFSLWSAASGGTQIGTTQTKTNVTVSEGLFTVQLDFGTGYTIFDGMERWLQIAVCCPAGSGTYATLSPRQPLTAAPYALSLRPGAYIHNTASSGGTAGIGFRSDYGDGVYVWAAGDGVYVYQTGNQSIHQPSPANNGFEVAGAEGYGLYVGRADSSGVYVNSAGWDGVAVGSAPNASGAYVGAAKYGVYVNQTSDDGVFVNTAGSPSSTSASAQKNGFEVAGAEGYGLFVGRAYTGVYVEGATNDGVAVNSAPNASGVYVGAAKYGVNVDQTSDDGVHVYKAGNPSATSGSPSKNGFEVAGAEGYGLYVGRADTGVYVQGATNDGVYANTNLASHEWGVYTPDKIYAGVTLASGGPLMLVAQNGSRGNLETGDVVAVSGTGVVFAQGEAPAPLVQRASRDGSAVMGVVYRRFVAEEKVEEVERGGKKERQTSFHTHSTEGPVAPGDYLLVVVLGPAQVKVEAGSGAGIRPGDLLTAGPGGQAAKASGAESYPPGTIVGQAMGVLDKAQDSGLIWMLVMPR